MLICVLGMVGGDKNLFARKGGASQKKIGKHCSWAWNGYVQPRAACNPIEGSVVVYVQYNENLSLFL